MNFIIKTHRLGTSYTKPHFFILNKGLNSGKPHHEPFTNSFVIIFQNKEDAENLYYIAYSLWKSNFWRQHLIGSVIPFLRIINFKKEYTSKAITMMQEHEQHLKNIAALKLLEQSENHCNKNRIFINNLRKAIVNNYYNS
jgi:hypothetical protein